MKRFIAIFFTLALTAGAEQQTKAQSTVPAASWEQLPQGFAIALTYDKNSVTLDIKNTSQTEKIIRRSSVHTLLFFADEHGALIPLGNHKDQKKQGDLAENIDPPDSRGLICFPSRMGVWYQLGVEITPEDWLRIKKYPVVCRLELYDLLTRTIIHLQSSPRMLVDNS